jgi:hypothetical protein
MLTLHDFLLGADSATALSIATYAPLVILLKQRESSRSIIELATLLAIAAN